MSEKAHFPSDRRADHWLLALIDELMMKHKPEPFEPDEHSTEMDTAKAQSYDSGWWDAVEQLSVISAAIRAGEYG